MVADLIGGQVEMGVVAVPAVQGQLQEPARLRAIGVMGKHARGLRCPDVPTIAEQGFPRCRRLGGWFAVIGPAKTAARGSQAPACRHRRRVQHAGDQGRRWRSRKHHQSDDTRSRRRSSFKTEQERYAKLVKKANIVAE